MSPKEKVRRKFISIRKKKYFQTSLSFFKPLVNLINKKKKKNISIYYPSNFEVDTLKLFEIIKKKSNLATSLPAIKSNGSMNFKKWSLSDPLKVNKYGFLEPLQSQKKINPDILIVPLVAYDKFHNRLGYGKGYYDRFLAKYNKKNKNTLTIGLAFSFQEYKKIPISKHDVKLDYILTEKGIF